MNENMADEVVYRHVARDGYAYSVPGALLKVRGDRCKIRLKKKSGEYVDRWVSTANVTRPSAEVPR